VLALFFGAAGASGCEGTERVAQQVVRAISGLPKKVSLLKAKVAQFWKGVTAAARRASKPLAGTPTRAAVRRAHQTVLAALQSAVKLLGKADGTCADYGLSADGDAYCDADAEGSYVIFCQNGEPYALECAVFADNAACQEVDALIDCATPPDTKADPAVMDALPMYSADSGEPCPAAAEGTAECEDGYVVVCSGGTVRELECDTFDDGKEKATCGVVMGAVTCGYDD
jgi:hypothetical protein